MLSEKSKGMERIWDSVKQLVNGKERMTDIYFIEKEYLDEHPNSGYLAEIMNLHTFSDYIDYLPQGAIVRKIGIMGDLPKKENLLGRKPSKPKDAGLEMIRIGWRSQRE